MSENRKRSRKRRVPWANRWAKHWPSGRPRAANRWGDNMWGRHGL